MINQPNSDKPLTDSEKISILVEALVNCQNCLKLHIDGELPIHIAQLCYTSVHKTYLKVTDK
jgi:hypothetical protein